MLFYKLLLLKHRPVNWIILGNAARLTGIQSPPTSMTRFSEGEKMICITLPRNPSGFRGKRICTILSHTLMHTTQDLAMDSSLAGSCNFYFG